MGYIGYLERVSSSYFSSSEKSIKRTVDVDKNWDRIMCVFGGGAAGRGPTTFLFTGKNEAENVRYHDYDDIELIYNYISDINSSNIEKIITESTCNLNSYEKTVLPGLILDIVALFKEAIEEEDIIITHLG